MEVHPTTEQEIVAAVRQAATAGHCLRALGSKHSVPEAYACVGTVLSLDRYREVLEFEGNRITVQAGMPMQELVRILDSRQLALPNLGGITAQTISGFLSTGSHGGSLEYSLDRSVLALRVVTAAGEILEVDREHEWFPAMAVSMGLLGVLSTVTLECIPAYGVRGQETRTNFADVVENYPRWAAESDYSRVLWYPGINHCDVWRADRCEPLLATTGVPGMPPIVQTFAHALNFVGTRARGLLARPLWRLFVSNKDREFQGRWFEVLPQDEGLSLKRLPHLYCEIWIPVAEAQEAMVVLDDYFRQHGLRSIPSLPVEFYYAPPQNAWLSPGYGRPSFRVNLIHYGCDPIDAGTMLRGPWELLSAFDARAHWGKYQLPGGASISRNYPRWRPFDHLRRVLDPDGLFLTPYWAALFEAGSDS